ncbi:alpha-1,2-fucosyltransferase [Roseateles paludis]|uniref:Alpha-1,2-fucosyltransferase n=1 Tax=Roseateles paludis TaxID=3145238 RepID=A0ABV0G6M7_9BURK
MLKFCLPWVQGRGAGLGNELIPWCRAFIAAQVLGARCLPPAFGLNQRRYWRHFGTSRMDWLLHRALRASLPHVEFTEADYLQHGGGDAALALERFVVARSLRDKPALLLTTQGMWGGMAHLEAARDFALSTLYQSRFAARNLITIRSRLNPELPVVGVHVRMGDFAAPLPPEQYRGKFNVALPPEWYRNVAQSIHEQLAGRVQFLVVSDAPEARLRTLMDGFQCTFTADIPDSDCSDLLALSRCDLLVCSVSSFSVWAAFLSEAPYLWYEPNLGESAPGWLSIWGHEPGQREPASGTQRALANAMAAREPRAQRAWATPASGAVDFEALAQATARHSARSLDLIRYGVVPPHRQPDPSKQRAM